jgi:alpha-galactosidase/6-phospho-beta-glucosidase family protein
MELIEEKGVINKNAYDKLPEEERLQYWQIGKNKFKLLTELTDEHLQNAFCYAQTKELSYHNKYTLFDELVEKIEDEASKRGIQLKDIETEFHAKTRKYKSKISNVKGISGGEESITVGIHSETTTTC